MQFDRVVQIARKELSQFFATPLGFLFLGAFLVTTLFVFFWVEAFFARNIADVRPLFEWFPVLLIFLSAALTMRMWSEERRTGTLEFLSTLPVNLSALVLGKFLACFVLLGIALLLTIPLPVTVDMVADLDWGPVVAGYLAALLLGGAYLSIGLFVSSLSSSQIVSLIVSSLLCLVFYLIGAEIFAGFFGGATLELMSLMSSGVRFEAITRGVVDVRDLYFYTSIAAVFLILNAYALERGRWATDGVSTEVSARHRSWRLGTGLLVINLLLANVWLHNVTSLRVDMTQGNIYSISDASKSYLQQLQEPLLIRGYFSAKTHPLLAPLVPRMKDLLQEYAVHGGGQVRVEVVDPVTDPELENEANTKYGIRAVPVQVQDRHQAALVNSYFDVLIEYGDEFEVLSFQDLIEVKARGEGDLDVQLKNPEFDITRTVKQVLYGFQGGNSVFANISEPVEFVGYISRDSHLPEPLIEVTDQLNLALQSIAEEGGEKFNYSVVDPEAGDGQTATDIANSFGFQPMAASLFDERRFYYYLTLQSGDSVVQVPLPEDLSAQGLQRELEEGLKRFASGLLKSVVLVAPEPVPPYMQQQGMPPTNQFSQLQGFLTGDFNVTTSDLADGVVPANTDLLVVVDPTAFTDRQVYAIDQYLMSGGTVVLASGQFAAQPIQGALMATPRDSGLSEWLSHHGVTIESALVMDPQNSAFPIPVPREVGGFTFQDLVMLDYPYFVDVRDSGLNQDIAFFAGLPQLTMTWASPISLVPQAAVESQTLVNSSSGSWVSTNSDVMPKMDEQGITTFSPDGPVGDSALGVMLTGRFVSYFADKPSPLLQTTPAEAESEDAAPSATENAESDEAPQAPELGVVSGVISRSPESARLIVFSSNDFLADQTLQMVGSADGTLYLNSVQLVANIVDWATEDQSLVGIRSRGNFNRTLPGFDEGQQSLIEWINYSVAVISVGVVMFIFRVRARKRRNTHLAWLGQASG
ncbi:MAG: Gldg family protein [Pseudomonadota bacterium]